MIHIFTFLRHEFYFRHAYETGCEDCYDYSNSVGYALPYLLQNSPLQSNTCKVHKVWCINGVNCTSNRVLNIALAY